MVVNDFKPQNNDIKRKKKCSIFLKHGTGFIEKVRTMSLIQEDVPTIFRAKCAKYDSQIYVIHPSMIMIAQEHKVLLHLFGSLGFRLNYELSNLILYVSYMCLAQKGLSGT